MKAIFCINVCENCRRDDVNYGKEIKVGNHFVRGTFQALYLNGMSETHFNFFLKCLSCTGGIALPISRMGLNEPHLDQICELVESLQLIWQIKFFNVWINENYGPDEWEGVA